MFLQEVVEYVRIEAKCPEILGVVQMQYRSASFNLCGRHNKGRDGVRGRKPNRMKEKKKRGDERGEESRAIEEGKNGGEAR